MELDMLPKVNVNEDKLSGKTAQPAECISEGTCGNVEKQLPRLFKLVTNLISDGRVTNDAWRCIDRELEYNLGRSAAGRLSPMFAHTHMKDAAGRFIGKLKKHPPHYGTK